MQDLWIVELGAYGWTRVIAYGNSLDTALEAVGEWCEEHAPGLLCGEQVQEAYAEAIANGENEDTAHETAAVDTIPLDCGRYLLASETNILTTDPTRAELGEIFGYIAQ